MSIIVELIERCRVDLLEAKIDIMAVGKQGPDLGKGLRLGVGPALMVQDHGVGGVMRALVLADEVIGLQQVWKIAYRSRNGAATNFSNKAPNGWKAKALKWPLYQSGMVVECILSLAKKRNVEMIVVGSHGHGALYHFVIGSITQGVLRNARHPVHVIRAPEKTAEPEGRGAEKEAVDS